MEHQIFRLYGIEIAMQLLRPGAAWEITNGEFTRWEDPRPCPTIEDVYDVMEKIKAFEESIPTVWLPEQIDTFKGMAQDFDKATA
jgi:hypothetical protein